MLTNSKINRLKKPSKLERHLDSDGLYLELTPSGSKNWRYRYKNFSGSWTMKALGSYPQITLERARELRDDFKTVKDYQEVSFEQTALEWLDFKGYASEKNRQIVLRRIETYLLPELGGMMLSQIRPKHLLPILKQLESRNYLELARRVQNIASQIFKYGVQNLYCETNPAEPLQGCTKKPKVKHMPAITCHVEFAQLLRLIDQADHLMPSINQLSGNPDYARCYYAITDKNKDDPMRVEVLALKNYRCIVITHNMFRRIDGFDGIEHFSHYNDKLRDFVSIDEKLSFFESYKLGV